MSMESFGARWGRSFYQGVSISYTVTLYKYELVDGIWTLVEVVRDAEAQPR